MRPHGVRKPHVHLRQVGFQRVQPLQFDEPIRVRGVDLRLQLVVDDRVDLLDPLVNGREGRFLLVAGRDQIPGRGLQFVVQPRGAQRQLLFFVRNGQFDVDGVERLEVALVSFDQLDIAFVRAIQVAQHPQSHAVDVDLHLVCRGLQRLVDVGETDERLLDGD